jgi:phage tail-like protein
MATFRETPYAAFNFLVSTPPLDPASAQAGFSEVSGLDVGVALLPYRAGNDKTLSPRFVPGLARPARVTLRRGLIGDLTFHAWIAEALGGASAPRAVTVSLLSEDRAEVAQTWKLRAARPVSIIGPSLRASASEIAVETLELVAESISVE